MIHTIHVWRHLKKHLLANKYESLSFWVRLGLFFVDLAGAVLFFPCRLLQRRHRQYDPRDIKKILILRMDGLGDLVISTAALREIRKGFPEAEITLAIGPWSQGIAPCIPFYDHLIVHDAFAFGVFRGERRINLGQEWAFIRRLRKGRFDLGIDLRGDILSIIPLFLSGIPFRFGRDRWGGGFLLTHPVSTDRSKDVHEKDKTLALPRRPEDPCNGSGTGAACPEAEDAFVERFLRECQISQGLKNCDRSAGGSLFLEGLAAREIRRTYYPVGERNIMLVFSHWRSGEIKRSWTASRTSPGREPSIVRVC